MFNKRGQEATITRQLLIFGLVALFGLAVAYGIYVFYDAVEDTTGVLPKGVEAKIQACSLLAQQETRFTDTWCNDFGTNAIDVYGEDVWINCNYPRVREGVITVLNDSNIRLPTCTENEAGEATGEVRFCESRKNQEGYMDGALMVNGKTCNQILQAAEALANAGDGADTESSGNTFNPSDVGQPSTPNGQLPSDGTQG